MTGDFILSGDALASAAATAKSVVRAREKFAYIVSNSRRAATDVDGFALSNATWTWRLRMTLDIREGMAHDA